MPDIFDGMRRSLLAFFIVAGAAFDFSATAQPLSLGTRRTDIPVRNIELSVPNPAFQPLGACRLSQSSSDCLRSIAEEGIPASCRFKLNDRLGGSASNGKYKARFSDGNLKYRDFWIDFVCLSPSQALTSALGTERGNIQYWQNVKHFSVKGENSSGVVVMFEEHFGGSPKEKRFMYFYVSRSNSPEAIWGEGFVDGKYFDRSAGFSQEVFRIIRSIEFLN